MDVLSILSVVCVCACMYVWRVFDVYACVCMLYMWQNLIHIVTVCCVSLYCELTRRKKKPDRRII